MRTAEEWTDKLWQDGCSEWEDHHATVKEIMIDAFKAGMTHAAEVARPLKCYPECKSQFCEGRNSSLESILMARDTMTALPEVKV